MTQSNTSSTSSTSSSSSTQSENMQDSPMMAHLLDALKQGTDIGHYGRLTFVMIARHFMSEEEMVKLLGKQPDHNETEAKALIHQVKARDYNPPKRERIIEWQSKQDFPICPTPDDPDTCNVYQDLRFPDGIYDNISNYYEEQAESEEPKESEESDKSNEKK